MNLLLVLLSVALANPYSPRTDVYLEWVEKQTCQVHPEPEYRFLCEQHKEIATLVRERPGVVIPFQVGETVQQHVIWGFRVRDPMRTPDAKILVFGGLHALEWVGVEVTVDFLLTLGRAPLSHVEAVVIPVINIDRRLWVEQDLIKGERIYRRSNDNGVDLNRDWTTHRVSKVPWRHLMTARFETSPAPLSQPETRWLDQIAKTSDFDAAVSLHCFGGYIYYPWAGRYRRPPNWAALHTLALAMKSAQNSRHPYRAKQLSHWWFLFQPQGTEIDHLYAVHGIPTFLIEMTRSGIRPLQQETWNDPFRMYNPVSPQPHTQWGVDALLGLIRTLDTRHW